MYDVSLILKLRMEVYDYELNGKEGKEGHVIQDAR